MILVLSGTKDGRDIVELLLTKGHRVIATTATEYGGKLYNSHNNLKVISQKLNHMEMKELIISNGINLVIDATHPYAQEVSKNIIEAVKLINIPYFRYERKDAIFEDVIVCPSFTEAAQWLKNKKGNVLLTIGSNHLEVFTSEVNLKRLYARVLPTVKVMEKCEDLGLLPRQIIAIQGPFSKEFNKVIYNKYDIKYMVTKDSGDIGGTREKILVAQELGIEVLLVERPKLEYGKYGKVIDEINKLIEEIENQRDSLV
ncbi:MAG: cobalt-precorrin-6A reductase [Firmicutes bacterium]|nr:cobalt-precorrin-6A reductase [Bacillota bacterium]